MKTIKNYLSILAMVLLSTLAFTACSSSDDDNNPGGDSSHDSAIIGSWGATQTVYDEDLGKITINTTWIFNSNGSGEMIAEVKGIKTPAQSFKWYTKDNSKLYMTMKDPDTGEEDTAVNTYAVSGKTLTIKADTGDVVTLTRK